MGDPKFSRRKYIRPSHPWEGERIKAENELLKKYGLKSKKELWRAQSLLRWFRQRARDLQARVRYGDEQAEKEREELLRRLARMGLLPADGAGLDDVLALDVEAILSRRLQTLAYMRGLSYTPRQARQMIVHGHLAVQGRKVTIPGYLVRREEEDAISYDERSPLMDELHPSRPGGRQEEAVEGAPPEEAEEGSENDAGGEE